MQKKKEEKRIAEEQAAKDRYWKIPICYDDDEDNTIAVTPVLLTEEPVDSLIIEDEHLDTIPATESDEVIKSSVEEFSQSQVFAILSLDHFVEIPLVEQEGTHEGFDQCCIGNRLLEPRSLAYRLWPIVKIPQADVGNLAIK
ncbi:hypothetical protein Tco_0431111 [Tanacetum coccineum]